MNTSASSVNTHAAMTPELMRDIRQRVQGWGQSPSLSQLDSDKQPNLIWSGRSGSFVRQRQTAFLRSVSQSSTQSGLQSTPSSNRSSVRSSASTKPAPNPDDPTRPSPVHLPRIPSKTLKERGGRQGDVIRQGDVTKRNGETPDDVGLKKVRRLSSQGSNRSSRSSVNSERGGVGSGSAAVTLRNGQPAGNRPSSDYSGKNVSTNGSRSSSSSHSERMPSRSSSRPTSSASERKGSSSNASTKRTEGDDVAVVRRQSSGASDKSAGGRSQRSEDGGGDRRSSEVQQTSRSSSRRGSGASSKGSRHRPSFHTIQGSSTPVLYRHSRESSSASSSSSPRSLPPAPLNLPDDLDQASALPLPSPPPVLSSPPPPALPSPPPTPPAQSPPASPPVVEGEVAVRKSSLFQPRPLSALSAFPLPTPPPTPKSASDRFSDDVLPSPPGRLPTPPRSPPPSSSPPPPLSGARSSTSSSSSSTLKNDRDSNVDVDFFNFLPDSLPGDGLGEGRRPVQIGMAESGADGASSTQHVQDTIEETQTLREENGTRTETTISTTTTTSFSGVVEQTGNGEMKESVTVKPPVLHFPPPPDYPPPLSPTAEPTRVSTSTSTSLLSPSTPYSPNPESPSLEQDSEHRLTSTSTDVVLGYLDNALEPYASAPPTPLPSRPTPPPSLSEQPDPGGQQVTSPPPVSSDMRSPIAVPQIVMDFSEPPTSSNETLASRESWEKKEEFTTTSRPITAEAAKSYLDVGRVHIQKKEKGDKHSKRRPGPTRVTKYEGSVKTVRRQIKPGHVGELREFFIQQDEVEDSPVVRHGKRRIHRRARGDDSSEDEDDTRSGYTTNSSDNEYDLEEAEKINSPDTDSPSPFSSPRDHQYDLNWEKKTSSSLNTSSGESTPKAKKGGQGYVFEKDVSLVHATGTDLKQPGAQGDGGTLEQDTVPGIPPNSLHTDSGPLPSMAIDNPHYYYTAPHPSVGMQHREKKSDDAIESGQSTARKELNGTAAATSLSQVQTTLRTRPSSSESESSEGGKMGDRQSNLSSTDSRKDSLSAEDNKGTAAQNTLTRTGFQQEDPSPEPSSGHGSSGDRQLMMDADYAVSDNSYPVKVGGDLGAGEEADVSVEGRKEGESGATTEGERKQSTTIFRSSERIKDDRTRTGENEGPSTSVQAGSTSYDFTTARSSTISGEWGTDRLITHTASTEGADERLVLPPFTPSSSHTAPDVGQSTTEVVALSDSGSKVKPHSGDAGGAADFLSILDNVQFDNEGFNINSDTAQKAKQLHTDGFQVNRNSVEQSVSETLFSIQAPESLSSSDAGEWNVPHTDADKYEAPNVSDLRLLDTEENGGDVLLGAERTDDPTTFSSALKSSPSSTVTSDVHKGHTISADDAIHSNDDIPEKSDIRDQMTAVVEELTSVSNKTEPADSHQRKRSSRSSSSSSADSSQGEGDNEAMLPSPQGNDDHAGEMYVYRDSSGDMYVMQDITDQTEKTATTEPTTAIVKTADDESPSRKESVDLHRLSLTESVKVDTKEVDVKKAREVISAFFTDGARGRPVKQSALSSGDNQHDFQRNSLRQESEFTVVAGNLSGAGQSYSSIVQTTPPTPEIQQQGQSATVTTTSTTVIQEETEQQVHIPRNAVPVLPVPLNRVNSTETTSDISPMVMDAPLPTQPDTFMSSQEPLSDSFNVFSSSFSDPHTAEIGTGHKHRTFPGDGINSGPSLQDFESKESKSGLGEQTSQTTVERSLYASSTITMEERPENARRVDVTRLRKISGSSLSSEEDSGGKTRYKVSRLARTNSDYKRLSRSAVDSGRTYDSGAPVLNNRSKVTVVNGASMSDNHMSFSENDSQYESQTSKTSAGDTSPTDEKFYRVLRSDKPASSPVSSARPASPPPYVLIQRTLDRRVRPSADPQQRELNRSYDAIFTQNKGLTVPEGEPELSQSLLNKSFPSITRHEEDGGGQRYRLVRTRYNGQKARSSSSESDNDSGVEGGQRHTVLSRVPVQGSKRRSNSTGSIKKAQLSLRPRSPSPAREYRVSRTQPQSEWDRRQMDSDVPGRSMYRVSRVLSSEDLPREVEQAAGHTTVSSTAQPRLWSSVRDVGDEGNRPFKVMHTAPTGKTSTIENQVFRKGEMPRMHSVPKSTLQQTPFPYEGSSRKSRPYSPPPRTFSPGPEERHRTVINVRVDDSKILPTTHYTETEAQHYRVLKVKPGDNDNTSGNSQSLSSPVSGYESDIERNNIAGARLDYSVRAPPQRRSFPPNQENASPDAKRYIVGSPQASASLEEGISKRGVRPKAASPPPQSFTGEWHKTTIDIHHSPSRSVGGKRPIMAPLQQQQQSKSYVTFNSLDDIRDRRHDFPDAGAPLQRSTSQTFTSERHFTVRSPTPKASDRLFRVASPTPTSLERQFRPSSPTPTSLERQFRVQSPTPATSDRLFRVASPTPTGSERQFRPSSPAPTSLERQFRVQSPTPTASERQFRPTSPTPTSAKRQFRVTSPTPMASERQFRPKSYTATSLERQFRVRSPAPTSSDRQFRPTSHTPASSDRQFRPASPTQTASGKRYRVMSPTPTVSEHDFSAPPPTLTASGRRFRDFPTIPTLSERQFRVIPPTPTLSEQQFRATSPIQTSSERQFSLTSPTPTPSDRPFSMASPPPFHTGSERHFRVMSPTPTTSSSSLPFRSLLSRDSLPDAPTRRRPSEPFDPSRTDENDDDDEVDDFSQEIYEEKTYELRRDSSHLMPERPAPGEEKDLRVLRGKILIQNRLDDSRDRDELLENMNVFDNSFHLDKDNPLYQSDPDMYKSLEAELEEQEERTRAIGQEVTQDITWETVDRIAKGQREGGQVELSPKPRKKQSLSTMLLSKLASIDSKDLRQHIDVQHHHEEVYGDVSLVHADGSQASSEHTSNFDSVNENVELQLKKGKAFVIIKVIAERIVPIDEEFNVWRKSQAIVTRNIEIDLHATEQRRRLYEHVMETRGHMRAALEGGRGEEGATMRTARSSEDGEDERKLTSLETLRLFSQILEVTEGKGDVEVGTQRAVGAGTKASPASAMDILY